MSFTTWRWAFVLFGALGAVWVTAFAMWFRDRPRDNPRVNAAELRLIGDVAQRSGHGDVPWGKLVRSRSVWLLWAQYFLLSYPWYFYITWLPTYLQEARGRAYDLSGRLAEAVILYRAAAARFQPPKKKWQAYTWLSHVYKRQDKYDDAERALNSALESAPEGAWSNGNLGTFYIFARGDYDKAIPALRKTVSIMDYGMAREGLALALYERWGDAYLRKADNATLAPSTSCRRPESSKKKW